MLSEVDDGRTDECQRIIVPRHTCCTSGSPRSASSGTEPSPRTPRLTSILDGQRVTGKLIDSLEIHQPRVVVVLTGIQGLVKGLGMYVGQLVVGRVPTSETGVQASHGCDPVVNYAELFVMAFSEGVLFGKRNVDKRGPSGNQGSFRLTPHHYARAREEARSVTRLPDFPPTLSDLLVSSP